MSKLNQVLLEWRPGDIHGTEWFKARGINQRLAYSYYEDGYLEKIGPGVFARKGDEMNPYGITRFLQQEYGLKLHLSGRTALELQGHAHYVALGSKTRIYLTSYEEKAFPTWIKKLEKSFEFIFKKSSLLGQQNFLTNHNESGFELKISTRELAALELIDRLDLSGSLETAENYLQSLLTLRSDTIQDVLEECNSIKAKRVFLYLAEKLNMPWFKKIKKDRINLGKGKRVIVKGGELDQKYQITVDRVYEENPF
jgi:hypothetical protein